METFFIKHYSTDERPTLKGNGFDGLEIGEDREEAESFVAFINASFAEINRLRKGHERYETVRLLNPRAFQEAWQLNIMTVKKFDEIIDDLKPFVRPNAELTGRDNDDN